MKLPNGITGFYNSDTNKPPQVDQKQFKQLCFDFTSRNGGEIIAFNMPQYQTNFYYAEVMIFDNKLYVLLNKHYPYLAVASVVESLNINFIDKPVIFQQFSPFYQVMSTVELNFPVNQILIDKSQLNSAELKQMAYWKPKTVVRLYLTAGINN